MPVQVKCMESILLHYWGNYVIYFTLTQETDI